MKKTIMVKFYVITVISAFMLVSCGQKEKKSEDIKMEVNQKQEEKTETKNGIDAKINNEVQNNQNENASLKRFGNAEVGFIDYPQGWSLFKDPGARPTAMQIAKNPVEIITLDKFPEYKTKKEAIKGMYQGLLNLGIKKENMKINKGRINGNDALMIQINAADGRKAMMIFTEHNNSVYYISVEGNDKNAVLELLAMVNKSWNAER